MAVGPEIDSHCDTDENLLQNLGRGSGRSRDRDPKRCHGKAIEAV